MLTYDKLYQGMVEIFDQLEQFDEGAARRFMRYCLKWLRSYNVHQELKTYAGTPIFLGPGQQMYLDHIGIELSVLIHTPETDEGVRYWHEVITRQRDHQAGQVVEPVDLQKVREDEIRVREALGLGIPRPFL